MVKPNSDVVSAPKSDAHALAAHTVSQESSTELKTVVTAALNSQGANLTKKPSFVRDLISRPISSFDKLKSAFKVPESLNSLLALFSSKGIKMNTRVTTAEGPVVNRTITLDPKLREAIRQKLLEQFPAEKAEEILQLLLTLPANQLSFSWSKGEALIGMTLPDGMALNFSLQLQSEPLRVLLQSIFKEYYKGIESLLSQEMVFKWDGAIEQFKISFPKQIGLKINQIDNGFFNFFGKNTTVVIPSVVSGTINFASNTLTFDEGTTFKVLKKSPLPDFTMTPKSISFDAKAEKLTIKFNDRLIPDIPIDLKKKEAPKAPAPAEEKPMLDFEFVEATSRYASQTPRREVPAAVGTPTTLMARIQKFLPIPATLLPLVEIFLGKQNSIDLNLEGKTNDIVFSNAVNIPSKGIKGNVSMTIPTNVETETALAELHPGLESLLVEKLHKIVGVQTEDDFVITGSPISQNPEKLENFLDFVRALPNQHLLITCSGNQKVELVMTLPTGMVVKMELDVPPAAKKSLFRTLLPKALMSKLNGIESILSKDFLLDWNGKTSEFSIKFFEQQELTLNQIWLKEGGFFKNILVEFAQWFVQDTRIVLPQEIKGDVDLKTATVKFKKGTEFKVGGRWIKVGLNDVQFDYDPQQPEKKEVLLGLNFSGFTGSIVGFFLRLFVGKKLPIDLTKSNVDDLDFEINLYKRRAHYPPR